MHYLPPQPKLTGIPNGRPKIPNLEEPSLPLKRSRMIRLLKSLRIRLLRMPRLVLSAMELKNAQIPTAAVLLKSRERPMVKLKKFAILKLLKLTRRVSKVTNSPVSQELEHSLSQHQLSSQLHTLCDH